MGVGQTCPTLLDLEGLPRQSAAAVAATASAATSGEDLLTEKQTLHLNIPLLPTSPFLSKLKLEGNGPKDERASRMVSI